MRQEKEKPGEDQLAGGEDNDRDQEHSQDDLLPEEESNEEGTQDDLLPEEESDCEQKSSEDGLLPGRDFDIDEFGSHFIEEEQAGQIVREWLPLKIPLLAETVKKFFPARR